MTLTIDLPTLQKAVRAILPLAKDGYQPSSRNAAFVWEHDALWIVSGSFQTKLAGAYVGSEREEAIENKFFDPYLLSLHINDSFLLVTSVKVSDTGNALRFATGKTRRDLGYEYDPNFSGFISIPEANDTKLPDLFDHIQVANLASTVRGHVLCGVYIAIYDGVARILSMNGIELGYVWYDVPDEIDQTIVLNAEFLLFARKFFSKDESPKFILDEAKSWFLTEHLWTFAPVMNTEKYPGVQVLDHVIDYAGGSIMKVPVDELASYLSIISSSAGKEFARVLLAEEEGSLVLTYTSQVGEESIYRIECTGTFDGTFLTSAAGLVKITRVLEDSVGMFVNIQIHKNGNWIVIRPDNGAIYCTTRIK